MPVKDAKQKMVEFEVEKRLNTDQLTKDALQVSFCI